MQFKTNSLYYGNCLEVMQQWPDQCIDLIYLDPPFNSKANYNQTFGKGNGVPAQVRAFTDTWIWNDAAAQRTMDLKNAVNHPAHKSIVGLHTILGDSGMLAYLTYMAERLAMMKNKLKPTGSIYLHCDPTASHYLKMVMDCVFRVSSFRNEITWKRHESHNNAKGYGNIADIILFYVVGNNYIWNQQCHKYSDAQLGRYK
ncbi:MAG: DNA methyltransferase [Gammaproteobacteria bacterium]|nr:DNA methyltransferase [Gammaproteobacteria bacterium]